MSNTAATTEHPAVVGKLSTLDRYLAVWIGVAMVVGLLVGRWIPRCEHCPGQGADRRHLPADRPSAC